MNVDQALVDMLYNSILSQNMRCTHFNNISPQPSMNSVWNKSIDEKKILGICIEQYKKYYYDKALIVRAKLEEIRDKAVSSYLTYNVVYYQQEYENRIAEVEKYETDIENMTLEHVLTQKLDSISANLDYLTRDIIHTPLLL
jgi:hypothetical protein